MTAVSIIMSEMNWTSNISKQGCPVENLLKLLSWKQEAFGELGSSIRPLCPSLPVPSPPLTKQLTGACASHPQSHPNGSVSFVNKQEHLGDFGATFCGQSSPKPSVRRIHPFQMYTILALNLSASSSSKRFDHGLRDKKAQQVGKGKRPSILPPLWRQLTEACASYSANDSLHRAQHCISVYAAAAIGQNFQHSSSTGWTF